MAWRSARDECEDAAVPGVARTSGSARGSRGGPSGRRVGVGRLAHYPGSGRGDASERLQDQRGVRRPTQQPQVVAQHEEGIERLRPRCSQFEHRSGERGRNTAIAADRSSPRRDVEGDDVLPAVV